MASPADRQSGLGLWIMALTAALLAILIFLARHGMSQERKVGYSTATLQRRARRLQQESTNPNKERRRIRGQKQKRTEDLLSELQQVSGYCAQRTLIQD